MFGLGRNTKDPLADAKAAERWLASFPENDPLALQQAVLAELSHLSERDARRSPSVLEAVFHVDAQTKGLRKALTTQYVEHASRSSRVESQLWQALFDITQGFLMCYAAFAREVSTHAQSNKWQAMLPELMAREIMHLGLDAKIRHFRYEQWIPAKWAELHTLFTLACSRQIERVSRCVVDADGGTTTIEHEYLVVLVLQLLNSGNLSARQLEWVCSELDEWCQPLRLSLEPSSVTSFYVDLGSRAGLRRRARRRSRAAYCFSTPRPLHALLMQNVVVIEQKIKGQPLSAKTARRSEQLNLLTKLASQVDPEFRPFARRGERSSADGSVDAIVGLAKIAGYLREEERAPIPVFDIGRASAARWSSRCSDARATKEPSPRAGARSGSHVCDARWPLGSQGREPDRVPAARADERRRRGHARHADRDPPPRPGQRGRSASCGACVVLPPSAPRSGCR